MLKKFTFSLSKNTELPASLDVFLSLFLSLRVFSFCLDDFLSLFLSLRVFSFCLDVFLSLFLSLRVFSLCLDEVLPGRWTKFPQRSLFPRITYIRKRMFSFIFSKTGSCILDCDWLKVSTNHSKLVLVEPV